MRKPNEDVKETSPVVYLVTKHDNGTLNLWQLTFADKSKYCQVLSIGHKSRASGHRFRVNDITCHPVLPLLLTTSHHNIVEQNKSRSNNSVIFASPYLPPLLKIAFFVGFLQRINSLESRRSRSLIEIRGYLRIGAY